MFDEEVYAMKRDMLTVAAVLASAALGFAFHWALTVFG
jgi:hypothetical protein